MIWVKKMVEHTKNHVHDVSTKFPSSRNPKFQKENAFPGKTCNVTSAAAPTIAVSTVSRLEVVGTPVQLMCRASGVPKPKVTWQRITDDDDLEEIDTESHMVSPKVTFLVNAEDASYKTY